jgi:N6-L-threonylcarbamoyladenine synthase
MAGQDLYHEKYGGIVPEIASRNHTHHLLPLIEEALKVAGTPMASIDGFAVTSRPGLIGALLTGLVTAKTLSLTTGKPFVGINHLEGHLLAPFLTDEGYSPPKGFDFPYIALAVSGGHTTLYKVEGFGRYKVLGRTLDDAAGEAFDKFAKKIGLGFPGGAKVDRLGAVGNRTRFEFPRAMLKDERDDVSFSGLKTSASRLFEELLPSDRELILQQAEGFLKSGAAEPGILADLCASFQEAVVDVLVHKAVRAARHNGRRLIAVSGGVGLNLRLREQLLCAATEEGLEVGFAASALCTDNAAMMAYVAAQQWTSGRRSGLDEDIFPTLGADLFRAV